MAVQRTGNELCEAFRAAIWWRSRSTGLAGWSNGTVSEAAWRLALWRAAGPLAAVVGQGAASAVALWPFGPELMRRCDRLSFRRLRLGW